LASPRARKTSTKVARYRAKLAAKGIRALPPDLMAELLDHLRPAQTPAAPAPDPEPPHPEAAALGRASALSDRRPTAWGEAHHGEMTGAWWGR
jgi:hypothetical protein